MSLDPPLSDAELLRISRERQTRTSAPPSAKQPERRHQPRPRGAVTIGKLERHLEHGLLTGFAVTIYGAPRTKKNPISHGYFATPAYKHWCRGIIRGLLPERLVLPGEPLNLEAHFYVDARGVPADLVGLLQGLADALQAAKVVDDDNWIRGFDGSRIHYDQQSHPHTQLELGPLQPHRKDS